MRRQTPIFSVLLLCLIGSGAAAQQQPAQPTPEQLIARLRYQWQALFVASIANARAHGQTPAQFGAEIGQLFAPSWPKDLTPQGLARGTHANVRLMGLDAELVEDTPEKGVVRFALPDSADFTTRYGQQGATLAEFTEAMKAIMEQIAAAHGLVWDQQRDGAWMIATVTRKR